MREVDLEKELTGKTYFNRFPDMALFARKTNLGSCLNRMFKLFDDDFKFYPKT
jgi:hypothetical protein